MRKRIITIVSILVIIICAGFVINKRYNAALDKAAENGKFEISNINIYRGTPAWELALAVKDENTNKIEKIAKNKPELLNYQDPKYGATLLLWSVGSEKYKSAEALLKFGADPNIATKVAGETPLFRAAGFSWVDNEVKKDPKYVKLLLSYHADPNKNYIGRNDDDINSGNSPLMNSIPSGIEKTKALVEAGADINYKTKSGETAAICALRSGKLNVTEERRTYAYYLIAEKKAKVNESYYITDPNEKFYPVDMLRDWTTELGSEEYKMKMAIVKEFANQGVNYWDTKTSNSTLEHIKKCHPNDWEDYIKKY
jgi:ankyrin repeat protein